MEEIGGRRYIQRSHSIVWRDVVGGPNKTLEFSYTSGVSHSFSNQWDSNSSKYNWFYDGNWIWAENLNFSEADQAHCGGEVATRSEGMGNTRCGNGGGNGLLYQIPDGQGGWKYEPWNGHVPYVVGPPYQVVTIDGNNFRVTGNE